MNRRGGVWVVVGALLGLTGVGFGAFGAHGLTDPKAQSWMATGAAYQLVHTPMIFVAMLISAWGAPWARYARGCFLVGCIAFAGPLYAMALGGPRWLGAVTPLGGATLMLGWLFLLAAGVQLMQHQARAAAADSRSALKEHPP